MQGDFHTRKNVKFYQLESILVPQKPINGKIKIEINEMITIVAYSNGDNVIVIMSIVIL